MAVVPPHLLQPLLQSDAGAAHALPLVPGGLWHGAARRDTGIHPPAPRSLAGWDHGG